MKRPPLSVANLGEHACGRVRRLLDSYLAGELTVESNHEILEHLEGCPPCVMESGARENLRAALRRLAASLPEPRSGLESEIRALLSREPLPSPAGISPLVLLAAAAVIVAAGVGVMTRWQAKPADLASVGSGESLDRSSVEIVALTQRQCAETQSWPENAPDPVEMERQIASLEDPRLVSIWPALSRRLEGYSVLSAHRCTHGGGTVVHLVVEKAGVGSRKELLSIIALPRGPAKRARSPLLLAAIREGVGVVGMEGNLGLVVVSSSRSDRDEKELGRRILPLLAGAAAILR